MGNYSDYLKNGREAYKRVIKEAEDKKAAIQKEAQDERISIHEEGMGHLTNRVCADTRLHRIRAKMADEKSTADQLREAIANHKEKQS